MLNTARECASLAFKDGDPNNIVDLMGKWSESILTGILLQAALKKLDGLGENPAARLSKDKNLVLLRHAAPNWQKSVKKATHREEASNFFSSGRSQHFEVAGFSKTQGMRRV